MKKFKIEIVGFDMTVRAEAEGFFRDREEAEEIGERNRWDWGATWVRVFEI